MTTDAREIKAILASRRYQPVLIEAAQTPPARSVRGSAKPAVRPPADADSPLARWEKLGLLCSANERRADEASRDVEAWLKSYYMKEKVGEVFSGTISAVVPFGIFVVLLVEIAEVTPPVGFNLFVLQNMTGKDSNYIARVSLPFFWLLVVCIAIITAFPQIVTWLPDLVMGVEK